MARRKSKPATPEPTFVEAIAKLVTEWVDATVAGAQADAIARLQAALAGEPAPQGVEPTQPRARRAARRTASVTTVEPEPVVAQPKRSACSKCGEPGHNARSCSYERAPADDEQPAAAPTLIAPPAGLRSAPIAPPQGRRDRFAMIEAAAARRGAA